MKLYKSSENTVHFILCKVWKALNNNEYNVRWCVAGAGHVESSCYHAAAYSKTSKNNHVAPNWTKNIISCFKQDQQGCTPGYL